MAWSTGRDTALGTGAAGGGGNELGKEIGFSTTGLGSEWTDGTGGIMAWGRGGKTA